MRLLAWVFSGILLLAGATVFSAPIYRAGESVPTERSIWHGELSVGYILSSHQLENTIEADKTSRLHGFNGRALWAPLSWLAVGAEMNHFDSEELAPAVKEYKVKQWAGIVKLTLSPNTTPRFYVLAGAGKSTHKITYDWSYVPFSLRPPVEKNFSFWTVGLGLEADIWKMIFVGIEGTLTHYNQERLARFYALSSKTQTALQLRAGVRF